MARKRTNGIATAAILGVLVAGALVYGFWPLIDRSAPATNPQPLPAADGLPQADQIAQRVDDRAGIDALVIHAGGGPAFASGSTDVPMNVASIRKSLLSLLIGIAVDKGMIDVTATLGELGIDESRTPLTPTERSATIEYLLMSRSGVYLPAGAESERARAARPERGSHVPGEAFHYNNWSFNVLGAIVEAQTGMALGVAFDQWLAAPLGMQDFHPSHVYFDRREARSDFPAYRMHLSARDLARIGALIVQNGVWQGRRIVSADWLERSLTVRSIVAPPMAEPPYDGYGYSWWVHTETGDAIAAGWGGQYLYVDRANALVLVARRDTGNTPIGFVLFRLFGARGDARDLLAIRAMVLAGRAA